MAGSGRGVVSIFRYDPENDKSPHFDKFEDIPWENMRVNDVLKYIYENIDSSLAFRYSCRAGLCGVCALNVNGKSCMSCHTIAEKEMTIEPPAKYDVIKDLVVDFKKKKKKSGRSD
jgi:fumarate reductase (CoM/CoB) subunit B